MSASLRLEPPRSTTAAAIGSFDQIEQLLQRQRLRIGESIRERRQALGLTMFGLAHLSGLPEWKIRVIELGRVVFCADVARDLDEVLSRLEAEQDARGPS